MNLPFGLNVKSVVVGILLGVVVYPRVMAKVGG